MEDNQVINNINVKNEEKKPFEMSPCCLETVSELAENNPMMACQHCEKIIKCFKDDSSFNRYARFCHSRKRNIDVASYKEYRIILFKKH